MLACLWNPDHIAGIAADSLHRRARELAAEQAVRGLDALSEVEFHPLLAAGFLEAGLGVFREHPYPGGALRRPRHAERERCDLVLSQTPGLPMIDPVAKVKAVDAAEGTLFASTAPEMLASEPGVDPADAFWLEVKLVGQHTYTRGVPGPNRSYSGELLRIGSSDIPKLVKEPLIQCAGVLLILFTQDDAIARHDLAAFVTRCIERDLPIRQPAITGFDVPDLIGNRRCCVLLLPVRPAAFDSPAGSA